MTKKYQSSTIFWPLWIHLVTPRGTGGWVWCLCFMLLLLTMWNDSVNTILQSCSFTAVWPPPQSWLLNLCCQFNEMKTYTHSKISCCVDASTACECELKVFSAMHSLLSLEKSLHCELQWKNLSVWHVEEEDFKLFHINILLHYTMV